MADQAWLNDLQAAVALNTSVARSAVVLIEGLAAKLAAITPGGDPNIMLGIIAELRQEAEALGAAIVANTPAADVPAAPDAPPGA